MQAGLSLIKIQFAKSNFTKRMYIKCSCVKDAMCVISVLRGTRAFNVYAWMHIGPSMQKIKIKKR